MPAKDPSHWLYRLDADEWLRAAAVELGAAVAALGRRSHRTGITHTRRAAGMALNAVLWRETPEALPASHNWGRSYMEHVQALRTDPTAPAEVQAAAAQLCATPAAPPSVVTIGRPGELGPSERGLIAATRVIIDWAAARAGLVFQDSAS